MRRNHLPFSFTDEEIKRVIFDVSLTEVNFNRLEQFYKKGDLQGFHAIIDELSLQEYRMYICHYFCLLGYEEFVEIVCKKIRDIDRPRKRRNTGQQSVNEILEREEIFGGLVNAYRKQDSKTFQSLLRKHNLIDLCYPIIKWICIFECGEICSHGTCLVRVDAIKFNHHPLSQTNDALNIRRNYAEEVIVPEWIRKYTKPQQSPVAYSISDIGTNRVTIKVRFAVIPPNITRAEIKATGGGILGRVDPITVNFVHGISSPEYIEIELDHNHIKDAAVNVEDIEWQWMCRCIGHKKWQNMDKTRHRIYTVLKEPVLPWKQHPYPDTQNPWSDVLDFSCKWARGANSSDAAAAAITTRVNQSAGIFEYDIPGGGACHYSDSYSDPEITGLFNCTAYIDRLNGGPGNGKYVNCADCASIVGTFSNILGCELWESKMGYGFYLNDIISIGSTTWGKPFSGTDYYGAFSYHEIAWKGSALLNDQIFDACLKVNGNELDATRKPDPIKKIPSLPLNILFDDPNSFDYREKLVTPSSIARCLPLPTTKTRRAVI
jgi:hypothetical protein